MFTHGKDAKVLVDQFDMSADLTQYNFGLSTQTVDVTTFSNADRVYLPGLNEGSISVQGVFNNATDRTDEELSALRGAETVISASPQSFAAIGDQAHMVNGFLDDYSPRSTVNDAVRFSSGVTASAGAFLGVTIHHNNQESTTGTFASVDAGASYAPSTNGAAAFLHVTQFDGTNATVTIEDAATEPTYGSLVAFTQVTAVGSEKVTVAGNVERFVRINLTGTFTTITFVVTFARLLT
jgi:hypothetical protein